LLLNAVILAAGTTGTPASSAGGFDITQLFLPLMLAFLVYMMWNNGRKRKKADAELRASLGVGANVVLHSGITGIIVSMDDSTAIIETTPGTQLRILVGAIRGLDSTLEQPAAETPEADAAEDSTDNK